MIKTISTMCTQKDANKSAAKSAVKLEENISNNSYKRERFPFSSSHTFVSKCLFSTLRLWRVLWARNPIGSMTHLAQCFVLSIIILIQPITLKA